MQIVSHGQTKDKQAAKKKDTYRPFVVLYCARWCDAKVNEKKSDDEAKKKRRTGLTTKVILYSEFLSEFKCSAGRDK
jgi:hypothetical protein